MNPCPIPAPLSLVPCVFLQSSPHPCDGRALPVWGVTSNVSLPPRGRYVPLLCTQLTASSVAVTL